MLATTKADVMEWVHTQLAQDAKLRETVEAGLAALRLEHQLIALREARGLSQAQAARLLGVSQPVIARLEAGRARRMGLHTLLRLVTAMGGELRLEIRPRAVPRVVGIRTVTRRRAAGGRR
jgi:predicted XRE-type DNA-binding protein